MPNIKIKEKDGFKDNKQSLQERLHTLLTRLSDAAEILKKWPETKTGDDSSIHTRATTKLITSIERIVDGIRSVEEKVNKVNTSKPSDTDTDVDVHDDIANKLRQIAVPLDLLDMMDHAGGVNPDCFARGLIKEALRQMGNLQRRKASMMMLANIIENGMKEREKQLQIIESLDQKLAETTTTSTSTPNSTADDTVIGTGTHDHKSVDGTIAIDEDVTKKKRKREERPSSEEPSAKR